jgi:hypothetical protein
MATRAAIRRGSTRAPQHFPTWLCGGAKIPSATLLIYLARPNSDAYITGETDEIPEGQEDWGYVLPIALFATLGNGLFFAGDQPVVRLASEIAAYAGTNTNHVLINVSTLKLAVYDPATSESDLSRAKKVLKIT